MSRRWPQAPQTRGPHSFHPPKFFLYCHPLWVYPFCTMNDLDGLLLEAGLNKAGLARVLGVDAKTVSRWKATGKVPKYAVSYLELLVKHRRCG